MGSQARMPFSVSPNFADKRSDFLIVGAGLSGIIAAFEAIKLGIPSSSIRILEAQNYIGGRTQTIRYGKRQFDTGAHWLHGGNRNLFYRWLKDNVEQDIKEKN